MTQKEFEKLDKKTQYEMLKEIDKNYQDLDLPIEEPIYDKDGNIKNKKQEDESLKKCYIISSNNWDYKS